MKWHGWSMNFVAWTIRIWCGKQGIRNEIRNIFNLTFHWKKWSPDIKEETLLFKLRRILWPWIHKRVPDRMWICLRGWITYTKWFETKHGRKQLHSNTTDVIAQVQMQSIICQMFLAMPLRLQNDLISLINHSSYDYRYCIIENHCKIAFLVPEKVWCLLSSIRKRASAVNDTNIIATCSEYLHEGREHDSFFPNQNDRMRAKRRQRNH